jgi:hypothetical protein
MDANARRTPGRLEDRFEAPDAIAKINGREYPLRDWSARGLSLNDYLTDHERGEKLYGSVHYSLKGKEKFFETRFYIVRVDVSENTLAAVFVDYDRHAALRMDEIFYPNG